MFEPIKEKHLYHTDSGNNYMLNPQCEEKKQVTKTLFLYQEPKPSNLKLQETLFVVSNFSYFIIGQLKTNPFSNIFMFSFKANLEMKMHQFSFELISIVQ